MKIFIADHAGFCFGVKRAVTMAENALSQYDSVYQLGPLVHNRHVVERLGEMGIQDAPEEAWRENSTIVSRSHGICKEKKEEILDNNHQLIDTTCPSLLKMYKKVEEMWEKGYNIIIIGDKAHPEMIALNSQIDYQGKIIDTEEEANEIKNLTDVFVLSQTTNREEKFTRLSAVIESNNSNVVVQNTICHATRNRQDACAALAKEVDAMIVIGGKHSSNTQKLAQVASKYCERVYPIESIEDLPIDQLVQLNKIGITAGASTPEWLIEEVVKNMENYSQSDFMEQVEDTMKSIHPKEIIKGEVIYVTDTEVMVNINYKSDGIIKQDELSEDTSLKPKDLFEPGQEIEVYVIKLDDGEGNVILSTRRVEKFKNWQKLMDKYEAGEIVEATIEKDVKGGLIANVMGINGFIPGSHVDTFFVRDLKSFIGKTVNAKIISLDEKKRRIVLSRKEVIEKEREEQLDKAWENIHVGDVVTGKVARLTDFGAFVDLGGVDGLLHVSDISWKRLKHPSEALKVGDEIEVKILRANRENNRISLGRKQLTDKPFDTFVKNNSVGDIVKGTVVNLLDFGAFVRVAEGVEGLVHVSQISHERVEKPSDELNVGDEVEVKITDINEEEQKVGLSIKETKPQEKKERPVQKERKERPAQTQQPRRQRRQVEKKSTSVFKGEEFENTIGSLVDLDFSELFGDIDVEENETEQVESVQEDTTATEVSNNSTEEETPEVTNENSSKSFLDEEQAYGEVAETEETSEDTDEEETTEA